VQARRGVSSSIRRATEADTAALRDALVLALAWRDPAFPPDPERFLRESGHGRLIDQWGRPGDAAVIAETPSGIAGAAWYRPPPVTSRNQNAPTPF